MHLRVRPPPDDIRHAELVHQLDTVEGQDRVQGLEEPEGAQEGLLVGLGRELSGEGHQQVEDPPLHGARGHVIARGHLQVLYQIRGEEGVVVQRAHGLMSQIERNRRRQYKERIVERGHSTREFPSRRGSR